MLSLYAFCFVVLYWWQTKHNQFPSRRFCLQKQKRNSITIVKRNVLKKSFHISTQRCAKAIISKTQDGQNTKEKNEFVHKSTLIEFFLRLSTVKYRLIDLDELNIFCHGAWSPECFRRKFYRLRLVKLFPLLKVRVLRRLKNAQSLSA